MTLKTIEKNIRIIRDTLKSCEKGYYQYQGQKVDLKLSETERKSCEVLLPDEVGRACALDDPHHRVHHIGSRIYCTCVNQDTFTFVHDYYRDNELISGMSDKGVLVLNLANPVHPGGGVRGGAKAQEEDLCRRSTLLQSLESPAAKRYYDYNSGLDTFMGSDAMILTPKVEVFKDEKGDPLEDSFIVSVLTCAAPNIIYGLEGMSQEAYEEMLYGRIQKMLKCAAYWGYRYLVLGAFGCGAFRNDAHLVSDLFYRALKDFRFNELKAESCFNQIHFAVLSGRKTQRNFDEFYRNFGGENFYREGWPASPFANKRTGDFVFFWKVGKSNDYLSQWYPRTFTLEGIEYETVEQYVLAKKALLFDDLTIYKEIMAEPDPAKCRKLGKRISGIDPKKWDECKSEIMYRGNLAKFSCNYDLQDALLKTGDAILAKASPEDGIWGIGREWDNPKAQNPTTWKGDNLLGEALMRVRDELEMINMILDISDLGVHAGMGQYSYSYYVSKEQAAEMDKLLKKVVGAKEWSNGPIAHVK